MADLYDPAEWNYRDSRGTKLWGGALPPDPPAATGRPALRHLLPSAPWVNVFCDGDLVEKPDSRRRDIIAAALRFWRREGRVTWSAPSHILRLS